MNEFDLDSLASSEISQRAKARWALLRSSLLSTKPSTRDALASNKHSIHRFAFHILDRNLIDERMLKEHKKNHVDIHDSSAFEYVEYIVPVGGNVAKDLPISQVKVYTKERKINDDVDINELLCHHRFGVDNTGNRRVWDCSGILSYLILGNDAAQTFDQGVLNDFPDLGLILSKESPFIGLDKILSLSQPCRHNPSKKSLKILELGAGMCAIPSLSLVELDRLFRQSNNHNFPYINVTITDGHPHTVSNNKVCLELSNSIHNKKLENTTNVLHLIWKSNPDGAKECLDMMHKSSLNDRIDIHFDLCLVSDCVHFTNFHADLAITIGRTLRVGGVGIMLQPPRGKSLKQFCDLIQNVSSENPLFKVDVHIDYSPKISDMHGLSMKNDDYDPNIHFPLLLVLTKLRNYDEFADSHAFVEYVRIR